MTPQESLTTTKPAPILFISLILTVIRCVLELKSREFCDFNDKTNDCNNGFELKYGLECGVLSPGNKSIVAIPRTTTPAFNSTPTCVGICQTSVIGYDLIDAVPAISIPITQVIKNENEIKIGNSRLWRHKE